MLLPPSPLAKLQLSTSIVQYQPTHRTRPVRWPRSGVFHSEPLKRVGARQLDCWKSHCSQRNQGEAASGELGSGYLGWHYCATWIGPSECKRVREEPYLMATDGDIDGDVGESSVVGIGWRDDDGEMEGAMKPL